MRVGVITFPGTLDDVDAQRAVKYAEGEAVPLWHGDHDLKGVDAVIERGHTYFEAGADGLFVEAFQSADEIQSVGEAFAGKPLVFNRTPRGFSPMVPMKELAAVGYRLAIFPMHLVLAAAGIGRRLLEEIRTTGATDSFEELMMSVDKFFDLVGRQKYDALELTYEAVAQS